MGAAFPQMGVTMDASASSNSTWKSLLPGSLGSLCIHAVILFLATWSMRGCQQGISGDPGGQTLREIGLFVVEGDDTGTSDNPVPETGLKRDVPGNVIPEDVATDPTSETTEAVPETPSPQETAVPADAPRLNELLGQTARTNSTADGTSESESPSVIGPGPLLAGPPPLPGTLSSRQQPPGAVGSSGQTAAGAAMNVPGQTTFMNIADTGRSFVYVIDISGSMGENNRLELACSQLKASLRLLQPTQEFQVIFYSDQPLPMRLRTQNKRPMSYATAANLELAGRQIDATTPQGGTQHMPALTQAIVLQPDVIYLLTDGREPSLTPAELSELRRMVRGITIHVIEFGGGGLSDRSESWLQQLARMTGGQYRHYSPDGL